MTHQVEAAMTMPALTARLGAVLASSMHARRVRVQHVEQVCIDHYDGHQREILTKLAALSA